MYFVRTPCEWGMDAISATLTFLWEVVGYVEGLFFQGSQTDYEEGTV